MMYKYYNCLGFFPIKRNEEEKDIHNGIFNNIPYFIKTRLHVDFLQYIFVMYNDELIIFKTEVIPPIPDFMIPPDCIKKSPIINFTTHDMKSKFELFSKYKVDALHLTESIQIDCSNLLYEYWDEGYTP